ncbi:MAG: tetratricopeptide repeat protein, partial [Bacteroidia bacterium]|nr:tetratricopeptide repeat protein [Bacteroidia bacterium]
KLIRAEKEKQILDKNKEENKAFISGNLPGQPGAIAGSSTFPFYNQAARNKGYSDFLRIWGSRSLKDNWAFSRLQTIGNTEPSKDPDNSKDPDSSKVAENTLMLNAPEERKKYYEFIPVTKAQKDKARYSMWESYIMAANIYYQQLNEPEKAMKLLQELLSKYPGNSFEANAWYLLAKINKDKGNMAKWSEYKDLIEKNYPDSPFLSILNNTLEKQPDKPKVEENTSDKIVEANYRKMLEAYQNKQFEQARIIKAENDKTNAGSALQSRFDLLDALMTGEEGDYEAYKSKLQAIIDNYPDSEVSETAKNYLYALNKKLNVNSEDGNSQQSLYQYQSDAKLFYFLAIPNSPDGDKIKSNILQYNSTYNSNDNLQLTSTFLDDKTQMIIVNNFADPAAAIHYLKGIATERSILQNTSISPEKGTHAVISQENFTKLLSDKKLDDYLQFYSKNYKI